MEYLMSQDALICIITGAVIGAAASQVMKGLGLVGNIVVGAIGGLCGGYLVDTLDFMDVGDIADPVIAGLMGSVVFMAVVWITRRPRAAAT